MNTRTVYHIRPDVKLGGEKVADKNKKGFEAGRKNEGHIGNSFLNCDFACLRMPAPDIFTLEDSFLYSSSSHFIQACLI
jgi:hypothetical protein